jgi:hypothetical protein
MQQHPVKKEGGKTTANEGIFGGLYLNKPAVTPILLRSWNSNTPAIAPASPPPAKTTFKPTSCPSWTKLSRKPLQPHRKQSEPPAFQAHAQNF